MVEVFVELTKRNDQKVGWNCWNPSYLALDSKALVMQQLINQQVKLYKQTDK